MIARRRDTPSRLIADNPDDGYRLWIGRLPINELRQSSMDKKWTICRDLATALTWSSEPQRKPPTLMVWHYEFPHPLVDGQIVSLREYWPLTPLLVLFGSATAAEARNLARWSSLPFMRWDEWCVWQAEEDPLTMTPAATEYFPTRQPGDGGYSSTIATGVLPTVGWLADGTPRGNAYRELIAGMGLKLLDMPSAINGGELPTVIVGCLTGNDKQDESRILPVATQSHQTRWLLLADFPRRTDYSYWSERLNCLLLGMPTNQATLLTAIKQLAADTMKSTPR